VPLPQENALVQEPPLQTILVLLIFKKIDGTGIINKVLQIPQPPVQVL
jgi:hypothetical protein